MVKCVMCVMCVMVLRGHLGAANRTFRASRARLSTPCWQERRLSSVVLLVAQVTVHSALVLAGSISQAAAKHATGLQDI